MRKGQHLGTLDRADGARCPRRCADVKIGLFSRGLSCVLVSPFLGFVGGTVFGTAQPFSCEIFERQYTKPCFLQDFDFPLFFLFVSTPIHCF